MRRPTHLSNRTLWIVLIVVGIVAAAIIVRDATGETEPTAQVEQATIQGKPVEWWARHAVQARKDANARRATVVQQRRTIRSLKKALAFDPSVEESVKLAHLVYPSFSEARAWRIIRHESWMTSDPLHARNPSSTATGLYQFLTSTFASTPFGRAGMSIYSPYAQSLAAGWMHANGRGCEWAIDC
jgi:hypothetical protein